MRLRVVSRNIENLARWLGGDGPQLRDSCCAPGQRPRAGVDGTGLSAALTTQDGVATLDALLDPGYVSVNAVGKPRGKAEILQLARDFAKAHPGQHGQRLPATSTIRVIGDAALVQHRGSQDTSVDVFYFRDGRWHAWYSQHSALAR